MGKKNSSKSSSVFPDIDGERIALPPNVEELTYTSSVPGYNDLLFRYRRVEVRVGSVFWVIVYSFVTVGLLVVRGAQR